MSRQETPSSARSTDRDEQIDAQILSTAATDVMEATLAERRLLAMPTGDHPDVRHLVRYLSRALGPRPAHAVERALLEQPELRLRLRQTRTILREIQGRPLASVPLSAALPAADEVSLAAVGTAWQEIVAELIAGAPHSRERWREQGWTELSAGAPTEMDSARAAWAAFLAYGRQWRLALALHAMTPAGQRGSAPRSDEQPSDGQPGEHKAGGHKAGIAITDIECRIEDDLTLIVIARIMAMASSPLDTLILSLRRDDNAWPLARGHRHGDQVEWRLPDFGSAMGLPPGPLPAQFFAFDGAPPTAANEGEADTRGHRSLLADVYDVSGQRIAGALAYVELTSAPTWHRGEFQVEIAIPALIRLAYPTHRLELALLVAEGNTQQIGVWPINEWGDAPVALRAPFPGVPDTVLIDTPILVARLIASP